MVDRFLTAVRGGDIQALVAVLAPDVVLVADGGGVVATASKPIEGHDRVAAFIARAASLEGLVVHAVWLNGSPAACINVEGRVDTAVSVTVEAGCITAIYAIRNPIKLTGLDGQSDLRRL